MHLGLRAAQLAEGLAILGRAAPVLRAEVREEIDDARFILGLAEKLPDDGERVERAESELRCVERAYLALEALKSAIWPAAAFSTVELPRACEKRISVSFCGLSCCVARPTIAAITWRAASMAVAPATRSDIE